MHLESSRLLHIKGKLLKFMRTNEFFLKNKFIIHSYSAKLVYAHEFLTPNAIFFYLSIYCLNE